MLWLLSLFAPLWGSEKAGRLAIGGCTPCDNRDIVETSHGKGLQSRNKPNACVQMADDPMVDTYEQYEWPQYHDAVAKRDGITVSARCVAVTDS